MKKIIVTGGSGFIGTNLVNFLIKKNYFVINIDKLTYFIEKLIKSRRRIKMGNHSKYIFNKKFKDKNVQYSYCWIRKITFYFGR